MGVFCNKCLQQWTWKGQSLPAEDFKKALRQVFAVKNSLSNVGPEQAVMGKSRALPASLVTDQSAVSHSLAESSSSEGIDFRDSLRKRELARKAFLVADNSSALRGALLRKPRKQPSGFDVGDWVLYWRQSKGNVKGERGTWHGPGQIITMESSKISHGGYLIRASPQHVRPASLREHAQLPQDQSQPDGENSPSEIPSSISPSSILVVFMRFVFVNTLKYWSGPIWPQGLESKASRSHGDLSMKRIANFSRPQRIRR